MDPDGQSEACATRDDGFAEAGSSLVAMKERETRGLYAPPEGDPMPWPGHDQHGT